MKCVTLLTIVFCLSISGCATDPVADLLKKNGGFALVRPPSDGEKLGDVYRGKNLAEQSIAMKDVMDPEALKGMMSSRMKQVDIPTTSGNRTLSLDIAAAYAGIAKAELKGTLARKYSVTVSKPVIYDSPLDSHLSRVIIPAIKSKFPDVPLTGKFIVRSLLEVGGLEYEFSRDDGAKIDLSADPQLVAKLTAALGGEWKISENTKLSISQPRFIGYRLARIDDDGGVSAAASQRGAISSESMVKFTPIPPNQYQDTDLRTRKRLRDHRRSSHRVN